MSVCRPRAFWSLCRSIFKNDRSRFLRNCQGRSLWPSIRRASRWTFSASGASLTGALWGLGVGLTGGGERTGLAVEDCRESPTAALGALTPATAIPSTPVSNMGAQMRLVKVIELLLVSENRVEVTRAIEDPDDLH